MKAPEQPKPKAPRPMSMTTTEIQTAIFEQTGIKTSVKKLTGSMKAHIRFSPMLQGGQHPKFPFEWRNQFRKQFAGLNFASDYEIDILIQSFEQSEPIKYSKGVARYY